MEQMEQMPAERTRRRLFARPTTAVLVVTILAAVLRLWNLGSPPERIFDEFYYSKSACIFLGYSQERCSVESDDEKYWFNLHKDVGAWVHPPLGKWAIAAGELAFGTDASDGLSERDAFGFRVSSAVAGTLTVTVFAILLQLLFGSALWTFVGGTLLATEGLSLVQSRVSMLDVFVAFWITLAFLFLVLDRRWIERRTPAPTAAFDGPGLVWLPAQADAPSPLWRPWRFATGVVLGLALATKWSGATAVLGVVVLAFVWEAERRRRAGEWRWLFNTIAREGFGIFLAFAVLPLVVYVGGYTGWFIDNGWSLKLWGELQVSMADYHANLRPVGQDGKAIHPYLSPAWQWLLLRRPVLYFAEYFGFGDRRVIYANGNPVIFWGAFLSIPAAVSMWRRLRDWRAGFAVIGFAALYLPWLVVPRPQFLFYALPVVPFLVIAMVLLLRDLTQRGYAILAGSIVVIALGLAVLFWPTYVGLPLDSWGWELRSWFPTWT